MAYSVDWTTRLITVPKSDLVDLGNNVFKLDLELCHQELRRLEWEFDEGLSRLQTLDYIPPLEAGGVIYARFVLLTNSYWFEFEDGQYAVLFSGANTNIHDFTVVNQVSIRPTNSAGLQDLSTLLAMAYMDRVVIDKVNGQAGIATPIGTLGTPSGNVPDAVQIADNNGISRLLTVRDLILDEGDDVSGLLVEGIDAGMTTLTINTLAVCDMARFKNLFILGVMDGQSSITECIIGNLDYFSGTISHSSFAGEITLSGTDDATFHSCAMGDYDVMPLININNGGQDVIMTEWTGIITFTNSTDAVTRVGIGILAGMVIIDASCTEGTFVVSGSGKVINNGGPNVIVDSVGLNNPESIANAVLDTDAGCP